MDHHLPGIGRAARAEGSQASVPPGARRDLQEGSSVRVDRGEVVRCLLRGRQARFGSSIAADAPPVRLRERLVISVAIDPAALSIVVAGRDRRPRGTGFFFLQRSLFVTAAHVVVENGEPREKLGLMQPGDPMASVRFVHPNRDLAVLDVKGGVCQVPLFPGHEKLVGSTRLICCGYSPSRSTETTFPVVASPISRYDREIRTRDSGEEDLIVFEAPEAERGYSGGPLIGDGGTVVGAVIQDFESDQKRYCRATSIHPLLDHLSFQCFHRARPCRLIPT